MDPDWTLSGWEVALQLADGMTPPEHRAALGALRNAFPPDLVETLRAKSHALVEDQLTNPGRVKLLELGHALATLGSEEDDLRRLRGPEYEETAAELRAALFFAKAGARPRRPVTSGRRLCEFIGDLPQGGAFAIEVKHPDLADDEWGRLRVEIELLRALSPRIMQLQSQVPPVHATLCFGSAIETLGTKDSLLPEPFGEAVTLALSCIELAADRGGLIGVTDLGPVGQLLVQEHPDGRFLFDTRGPPLDSKQEALRLRRTLNRAMQQVEDARLPGFVLMDTERNAYGRSARSLLSRWAARKSELIALLIVDRFITPETARVHSAIDVLPGPKLAVGEDLLDRVLEVCDAGHVHYNPVSRLVGPCSLTAWLGGPGGS